MDKSRFGLVAAVVCVLALSTGASFAAGPDVIVGDLPAVTHWGELGGVRSYSIGTTSCNIGDAVLQWQQPNPNHPVIGQNMFRLKDGRIEQIGQAWLKHGFCALQGSVCEPCSGGAGCLQLLNPGCSDPYSSGLNGSQGGLGPKSEVNPSAGTFPYPFTTIGVSGNTIFKRVQVLQTDLEPALNPGALYFVEGQYVHPGDSANGKSANNASYRQVNINSSTWNITVAGSTKRESPGILAWFDQDPTVKLGKVTVADDGGTGFFGRFWVLSKATDLGGGTWHYEYAVQNLNSDRGAREFEVALPVGATVTNVGFHDVPYHSGEPYDGTDWAVTIDVLSVGFIRWSTDTFAVDPNSNALRWGTLYNFRFDADVAPAPTPPNGTVTLGLFSPGTPDFITSNAIVPDTTIVVPVPSAPTNVIASSNSCDAIDVAWDAVVDATSYDIYRNSVDNSGTALLDSTTTGLSHQVIIPGENGSTWFIWVQACSSSGCSGFSIPTASTTFLTKGDFEPNGLFDGRDVNGFVDAALADDACADLAAPFGVIDVDDMVAFVNLLIL